MLRARLAPLALASVAAAGCAEDPSFQVRWRLHPFTDEEVTSKDAEPLVSVDQCTELGIGHVRLTTRDGAGTVVDERQFACFPRAFSDPEALMPGPQVGPGNYSVTLTALGRRDVPFCADEPVVEADTDTDGEGFVPECSEVIAADAQEVVVRETGEGKPVPGFVIVGAPECSDGVDNDRDGFTDLADPSCDGDRRGVEVGTSAGAQIIVRPELMSGNPSAYCAGMGIAEIELDIAGPTATKRRFPCTTTSQTFSESLDPGDYQLAVTGIGYDGKPIAVPTLDPAVASFNLVPEGFRSLDVVADFTIASFLAPIEAGFSFSLAYIAAPGDMALTTCTPGQGNLVLDRARITVLDADLQVVPTATLRDGANPPIVLDGVTTVACEELGKIRDVQPLVWDDAPMAHEELYLRVEAFAAGSDTPCFGNPDDPALAAPNASLALKLPRLSDQGACAD
ncbi:hypothetical protein [Nannocystis radixulma]|uniref:Lipoprotein n=1 Tax=Nannocystis radixulma TaxID=2995305 RepID=A0ABT5BLQ3_9BACT|nr:hypothetical protein [Nannocystis radixulma]MDC0675090.1 hypothetical protein [Nannocystis radixulma]